MLTPVAEQNNTKNFGGEWTVDSVGNIFRDGVMYYQRVAKQPIETSRDIAEFCNLAPRLCLQTFKTCPPHLFLTVPVESIRGIGDTVFTVEVPRTPKVDMGRVHLSLYFQDGKLTARMNCPKRHADHVSERCVAFVDWDKD